MYYVPNTQSSLAVITATGKSAATYMQDFTKSMCQSQASSGSVPVTDARDNNTYNVRYINGNCWMVQNLRYMGDTVGSTSTTTTWYLKSATSNVSADKTMTMTDLTSGNTYDAARFHNSGNTTTGVWYNYAAASAMTITGSSNTTAASQDICPKNWRLPTNSEQLGITSYSSQFSPVTGGRYNYGNVTDNGIGYWWSATSSSSINRFSMYYYTSLVTDNNGRGNGLYVRCIRDADTMQSITADTISSMSDGDTVELKDARDNNVYTTRKINGNLWMVQNLRYVGDTGSTSTSMIMKSATSNISTDQNLTIGDLTLGNDYNNARIHNSGNTTTGVWYNYAAASAGYVTDDKNSTVESTESVCPKNWRLPTNSEQSGITSYKDAFSPVTGGNYSSGRIENTARAYWWSSTPNSSNSGSRYYLYYNGSSLSTGNASRSRGYYVRCVHN